MEEEPKMDSSSIHKLIAARELLNTSLEKSRNLGLALDKTKPRFEEIKHRLPCLESEVKSLTMRKCSFIAVKDQIDCAIGPVVAVLKVFDTMQELEKSLLSSDPCSDLFTYLLVMKQLEEAMKFLAGNCRLAVQWLEGIVDVVEGNSGMVDKYIFFVKKSLRNLRELQGTDVCSRMNGGILFEAMENLETEFRRLLVENSAKLVILPVDEVKKLQAIVDRLKGNGKLESCISVYVEVRCSSIRKSMQDIDLEYLEKSITEFDDVEDIEGFIDNWCKDLMLVVKQVFEPEHKLCSQVFSKIGLDICTSCFAKIVTQSGILSFLQFGKNVTKSKKNPIKLLKLLDMFATLDNLRVDFNRVFGGKACGKIQILTRDLIKRVVNGACEIFWELPLQVELQRQVSPPSNGSVPKLVTFVTEYCNQLLGDNYKPVLTQLLVIHQSWKQEKHQEGLLTTQVYNIVKEIALNLDSWSSKHDDITLSYLFMMNNHCHFCTLKGTKLGDMMGDSWLRCHEQYRDYYAALYVRESWGRLLAVLSQDGLVLSPGRKLNTREMIKKRLKAFTEAFDCLYKKQSNWVVVDKSLREKICDLVVQAVVPAYRSYLQSYRFVIEQDVGARNFVRYTEQNLEMMLSSLFEPKLRKYGSSRNLYFIGKIKNVMTSQSQMMLTAT